MANNLVPKGYRLVNNHYAYGERDDDGRYDARPFEEGQKNQYGAEVHPGPVVVGNHLEYEVEAIYGMEEVDGVEMFAVKWRGFGQEYNTLEPAEHVCECLALRNFVSESLAIFTGARTRSTARRGGVLVGSVERGALKPLFERLSKLSTAEDIRFGDNKCEEEANVILRRMASENKFCVYLGFFSPKSDPILAVKYELEFLRELTNVWKVRNDSQFVFYGKTIGHPFKTVIELNRFIRENDGFKGRYVVSVDNIAKEFRPILRSGKGVIALIVSHRGLLNNISAQIHCRVLVVFGLKPNLQFRLFDPFCGKPSTHGFAVELKNKLETTAVIKLATGPVSGGLTCLRDSIRFASMPLSDSNWESKHSWVETESRV